MGHLSLMNITVVSAILVLCYSWFKRIQGGCRNPAKAARPPGPKPLPFIGNLLDVPKGDEAGTFAKWALKYGPVVYLEVLGRPLVILNSTDAISDLLDKRSQNYSDRTHLPMLHDLLDLGWFLPQAHYGEFWRRQRRLFHRALRPTALERYDGLQYEETSAILKRLLETPEDFRAHIRYSVQSKILRIAYGYRTEGPHDSLIAMEEEVWAPQLTRQRLKFSSGLSLVVVKYLPEWVPGAKFQRQAREWRGMLRSLRDAPFLEVKRQMINGTAPHSFVSTLLEENNEEHDPTESDEDIKASAAAVYGAGSDTTFASLYTFILAMLLHPAAQKRAQAELDRVIGDGRLPTIEDRPRLPYIEATLKELMRWEPVAPIGVPHMVSQDDVYDGYFLPAGSTVFGNTWTILHDEKLFPNSHIFDPQRFIGADGEVCVGPLDPTAFAFGYGRRICPGRHLADVSLWITISSILTVFDITPSIDENGHTIEVTPQFVSGVIRSPKPFKCTIKPRSERARQLILDS
ncbi:hypothetical protein Hypma_001133 [Hypsizygus marmoreus]|uniref:O-methylsterigmatocystin oxidoreductase n=1 Tax=Hypsizygus marmoreus TaxID=39966 RepID=A0A369J8T5_HYPMA|nr:hypothetical protein Hypma_001133 [Hypsizygus marmoreus]